MALQPNNLKLLAETNIAIDFDLYARCPELMVLPTAFCRLYNTHAAANFGAFAVVRDSSANTEFVHVA